MVKAHAPRKGANSKELLERFSSDEELLAKHGVTEEELELLKTVSLFGNLSSRTRHRLHPEEHPRNQARQVNSWRRGFLEIGRP